MDNIIIHTKGFIFNGHGTSHIGNQWKITQKFLFDRSDAPTIHKKDFCLREKYPETWKCLPNPIFFTEHEYDFHSEIDPTFQALQQFLKTSRILLTTIYIFLLFFVYVANFMQESRNLYVRWFCFHIFVNRPLRSKSDSKWKMEAIWRPLNLQSCNQRTWSPWKKLY